jgi:hypothetical protein
MKKFHTFAVAGLAALGLTTAACERRAPTADTQGRGTVESRDPSAPATTTTTRTEVETDVNRQPVSGTDTTTPAPSGSPAAPSTATGSTPYDTTGMATGTSTDIYWVSDDGQRTVISDSMLVTKIQQKLKEAGVYQGETDGRTSAELGPALRQFQAKRGLPQTGVVDERTADAMDVEWDKVQVSGSTAGERLDTAGRDIEAGATEMKEGAKELGRDLRDEAKQAGENMEEGAKDVKDFVDPDKTETR